MANKDYYKLLGIGKSATKEEIKKAYKKLALKFHPDRAPEEKKKEYEEHFKEISEAAAVLADDKKRKQYDQFGSSTFQGGAGFQEGYDFSDIFSQFRGNGNFDDIFDQLFGGSRRSRSRRGADLLYETEITLEEAYSGTNKSISLNKLEACQKCHGKGAHKFEQCKQCNGSGFVKRTQRTPFGLFQQTGPCAECHSKGEISLDSCSECHGEGVIRKKKTLEVSIPKGIEEGMRLRVSGEGEVSSGGNPGDLYIQVYIKEHKVFTRKGKDLHLIIPISFSQAVLGDEIEVPIIDGKAQLKIPAGTQSETIFRMRGKGLPAINGEQGDQLVKVKIEVPTNLSKKQKELIKQLEEEKPIKGFFKKFFD